MRSYAREAAALLLLASALYAVLALASYRGDPLRPEVVGANWVGPVGVAFAAAAVRLVGVVAWLVPLELGALARPLLLDRPCKLGVTRVGGDVLIVVVGAALIHIALPETTAFGAMPMGGLVGELFGEVLRGLFSTVGSFLIGLTIVSLILLERATFSFIGLVQRLGTRLGQARERLSRALGKLSSAWGRAREISRERREEQRRAREPAIHSVERADAIIAALADDAEHMAGPRWPVAFATAPAGGAEALSPVPEPHWDEAQRSTLPVTAPTDDAAAERSTRAWLPEPGSAGAQAEPSQGAAAPVQGEARADRPASEESAPSPSPPPVADASAMVEQASTPPAGPAKAKLPRKKAKRRARPELDGPTIVDTSDAAKTAKSKSARRRAHRGSRFELPGVELLEPAEEASIVVDDQSLRATAKLLEKTLNDYGVVGEVKEIHPGPTVTTFEVAPAAGTKVSKVAGLADDLALGLSRKVRIIAPIAGKNRVGFEVPNDHRQTVSLRGLIEDRRFMDMKAPLPCVLGRNIIGAPVFADLAAMPHVIVAGATGAGKSVGLNVMLVSLLYRRTPEEMRLLLIDPKVVEMAPFDRIPHLLLPVVTDMKKAANALKWAVDEMERRYQLFADAGTRNIKSYNKWVGRVLEGKAPRPRGPAEVEAIALDGGVVDVPAAKDGSDAPLPERLPYIVIVVEEFSDLMMQQGKDVETAVARLAQKARAAGMHVILATQRPSVDVITGMIKANFPTRIAYRVAQKVDSRTILDQQGAEHLLGKGDMLVKLNGTTEVHRVQCPFCSEAEVQRVTELLRKQGEPDYDESIVADAESEGEAPDPSDGEKDALYDQAVRVVAETRRCSTSWIQRKLGIGYNRAAKIVEAMEQAQIVGPPNGSKDREIFISPH